MIDDIDKQESRAFTEISLNRQGRSREATMATVVDTRGNYYRMNIEVRN